MNEYIVHSCCGNMDEYIKHICLELDICRSSRTKMIACGICTIEDLNNLHLNDQLHELEDDVRRKLLLVSDWTLKNRHANILEVFCEAVVGESFSSAFPHRSIIAVGLLKLVYTACAIQRQYFELD